MWDVHHYPLQGLTGRPSSSAHPPPALAIAPEVDAVLKKLRSMPKVAHAAMSGSGATCYGLVSNLADARQVARVIQVAHMGWWVAPAAVL